MKRCLPLALLVLAACKGTGHRAPPSSGHPLERGMFFTERDARGEDHPISSRHAPSGTSRETQPEAGAVERVADGATVDVNSRVDMRLLRDELGAGTKLASRSDLLQDARALRDALGGFKEYVRLQAEAVRGWRQLQAGANGPDKAQLLSTFAAQRVELAKREIQILEPVRKLWSPEEQEQHDGISAVIDGLLGSRTQTMTREVALERLGRLLNAKIESLSGKLTAFRGEVESTLEQRKLRVEAFVIPAEGRAAGEDVTAWGRKHAVHVDPNYDSLEAGAVQSLDEKGLLLTEQERQSLQDLMRASQEIAKALNEVRSGEKSWSEAFQGVQSGFAKTLGAALEPVDELLQEFRKDSGQPSRFDARIEATRKAATAFLQGLGARLEQWNAELKPELKAVLAKLQDSIRGAADASAGTTSAAARLAEILAAIQALRAELDHADPSRLPQLLAQATDLGGKIAAFLKNPGFEPAVAELREILGEALKDLEAAKRQELEELYASSGLQVQVDGWAQLVLKVRTTVGTLKGLLLGAPHLPHPTDLVNPAAFDVALEIADDPSVDLRKTTRKAGDYLYIHAQLLENDQKVDDLSTTLRIEKLGWHADLVPSVVFVTADQLRGAEDNSGFSPALSWMWSYGPRDDEDDPYASRSLGWGAGLHAVFLHFAPDNAAEIGLGATVGLWGGRVQFGAGYNPFATDNQDGRFYYFIGSSLIPLLQALGGDK